MTGVSLSAAERRICAVTADGVLLVDAVKSGEMAVAEVERRLMAALGRSPEVRRVPAGEIDAAHGGARPAAAAAGSTEIETLTRRILGDAARLEASDIHLALHETGDLGTVALRVRGKMTPAIHQLRAEDCRRLLNVVFAWLDEGPQTLREGRAQSGSILQAEKLPAGVGGIRVQTVWPGGGAFHLNMRLRHSQSRLGLGGLDDLGLPARVVADLRYMSTASSGLVLVSGPTEAGKSTVMATVTREIHLAADGLLTIASAEDPVEEWHEHLLQIPVNTDELGDDAWIEAQKLFTRIAPDVGQIGEIRTGEAAERAYSFAETGKLTFATIHVAAALEIPHRLVAGLGIGADRALDPARNPAWTSQRLLPLLCSECRLPGAAGSGDGPAAIARSEVARRFDDVGIDLSGVYRRGPGCAQCDPRASDGSSRGGTPGLVGRRLVLEVVLPNEPLCQRLAAGDRRGARDFWIAAGGLPMSLQGWDLVQAGLVDLRDYRHHIGGAEELQLDLKAAGKEAPARGRAPVRIVSGGSAGTVARMGAD